MGGAIIILIALAAAAAIIAIILLRRRAPAPAEEPPAPPEPRPAAAPEAPPPAAEAPAPPEPSAITAPEPPAANDAPADDDPPDDDPSDVPGWADPMTADELDDFLDLVGEQFRRRGLTLEIDVKDGSAKVHHGPYEGTMGLANLAAMCNQSERDQWEAIIVDHFQSMERSVQEEDEIEARLADFSKVQELIHVKVYHPDYVKQLGPDHVIFREQMPGAASVLVYDMPQSVRNVNPEHVKRWTKSVDELFRLGFRNVREHYPPSIQDQLTPDNVTIKAISDDNFFNTTHALLIEHYPELIGPHGALLGLPNRGVFLAYPIAGQKVILAIQIMLIAVIGMFRDGPGSISDKLYWYHDGVYLDLPYTLEGNNLNFNPPDEFVELLGLLAKDINQ